MVELVEVAVLLGAFLVLESTSCWLAHQAPRRDSGLATPPTGMEPPVMASSDYDCRYWHRKEFVESIEAVKSPQSPD